MRIDSCCVRSVRRTLPPAAGKHQMRLHFHFHFHPPSFTSLIFNFFTSTFISILPISLSSLHYFILYFIPIHHFHFYFFTHSPSSYIHFHFSVLSCSLSSLHSFPFFSVLHTHISIHSLSVLSPFIPISFPSPLLRWINITFHECSSRQYKLFRIEFF